MTHKGAFQRVTHVVTLALTITTLAANAAQAGPTGWTRFGPQITINTSLPQAGLARSADGNLHVVFAWDDAATGKDNGYSKVIAPDGTVAPTTTLIGTWGGLSGPAVAASANSLIGYFPGLLDGHYGSGVIGTAPLTGNPWMLPPKDSVASECAPYTTPGAITLGADGTIFTAGAPCVHRGTSPDTPNYGYQATIGGGCCGYNANLATDGATGQVWIGWASNANGENQGVFAHEVDTATGMPKGSPIRMPSSVTQYDGHTESNLMIATRVPITGRVGQPGIFMAYGKGYPSRDAAALWKVGDPTDRVVTPLGTRNVRAIDISADPSGRIWVVWGATNADGNRRIFARRYDADLVHFTGAAEYALPKNGEAINSISAGAAADGVDVVANLAVGGKTFFYHRRLLPGLKFRTIPFKLGLTKKSKGKTYKIGLYVANEKGAVANATVKFAGKTATTDQSGRAFIPFKVTKVGKFGALATVPGYAPATTRLEVVQP